MLAQPILRPDLGVSPVELFERVERVHGRNVQPLPRPGVSVAGCDPCEAIGTHRPFGGQKKRPAPAQPGLSVGQSAPPAGRTGSAATAVMDMLNRLGVPACRVWGAEAPGGRDASGCPRHKKVCGAILPYGHTVPMGATAEEYELFAKVWFWPLFWVDSSNANVTVEELEYTQDPVFENGTGSANLDVSTLLAPDGYYGFVPGLPAFDNRVPLVHILANADGANDQPFQGMYIGVSIRN